MFNKLFANLQKQGINLLGNKQGVPLDFAGQMPQMPAGNINQLMGQIPVQQMRPQMRGLQAALMSPLMEEEDYYG